MPVTRHTWTVDSLEEGIAAVEEEGRLVHLPVRLLPEGVREGDVLAVTREVEGGSATLRIEIDRAATETALARSREQLRRMAAHDPGGDIVL